MAALSPSNRRVPPPLPPRPTSPVPLVPLALLPIPARPSSPVPPRSSPPPLPPRSPRSLRPSSSPRDVVIPSKQVSSLLGQVPPLPLSSPPSAVSKMDSDEGRKALTDAEKTIKD